MSLVKSFPIKSTLANKFNHKYHFHSYSYSITIRRNRHQWRIKGLENNVTNGAITKAVETTLKSQDLSISVTDVDSFISSLIDFIIKTGKFLKLSVEYATKAAKIIQSGVDATAPVIDNAIKTVTPVAKDAYETVKPIVQSGTAAATSTVAPIIQSGGNEIESFLRDAGLDTESLKSGTETITNAIPSTFKSIFDFILNNSPTPLAYYILIAIVIYYTGPFAFQIVAESFKGYRGDVSPASALDSLTNLSNSFIIDIRTQNEKENSGVPNLPKAIDYKSIELEFAFTYDKVQRNQLRSPENVECKVTALKISYLKKVSKSSTIFLLDKTNKIASKVAQELSKLGFDKIFVIDGGFSGWQNSKLQIKPSQSVSKAEILSPKFITPRNLRDLNTVTTRGPTTIDMRRQLPPPRQRK